MTTLINRIRRSLLGDVADFSRHPLAFLAQLHREQGDLARFRLGKTEIVQINDPELIHEVLVVQGASFVKTGFLERARPVLGNGLVTNTDQNHHRMMRQLIQPAFSSSAFEHYADIMTATTSRYSATWQDGETVDFFQEMLQLTLSIVAGTLFGVGVNPKETHAVEDALTAVMHHYNRLLHPLGRLITKIPLVTTRRFESARRLLHGVIERLIRDVRNGTAGNDSVIRMLLSAQSDGRGSNPMSDQQLRDEVLTLFVAGHETIATALTWTWYLLSRHPDVARQMRMEVDTVLNGRSPQFDDVPRLEYTKKVLAEGMRLYPPIWAMTRKAICDCTLGGHSIPAGTTIGMSQYITHRDPRFFDRPAEFDPGRWTPERMKQRTKQGYFPFGGGSRSCIGESFSWLEGALILAILAQNWESEVAPDASVALNPMITLRPRHGIRLTMRARPSHPVRASVCPISESELQEISSSVPSPLYSGDRAG